MNNFESDLQPPLPYPDSEDSSEKHNVGDKNTGKTQASADDNVSVELTTNPENGNKNYFTRDGSNIDPNLRYEIYRAVKSFVEKGIDTFSVTDFITNLRIQSRNGQISDAVSLYDRYKYKITLPKIVFLEETDIKDPDNPDRKLFRILRNKFEEFVSDRRSRLEEIIMRARIAEQGTSINPEIPSEEIGLSTLLKTVLSESKIKYWSKSDSSSDINNNEGMLTREPLITEILKIMGLDTQKCRWMAEEILESANRKNMLETVQHNEKGEPYFVLNFVRRLELNNIDNDLKTLEMANFINEKRNYALSGKKENGTENIQDTLTGLEWED